MEIIGLCGGSGSGKGTVARLFSEYGFKHIDTDDVYHKLISYPSPCVRELVDAFGTRIMKGGRLDRGELWKVVFGEEGTGEKKRTLNRITHKHILEKTKELIEKYRDEGAIAVLVDAPLLFESEFNKICSVIICVSADENIRKKRIMERDGIDELRARLRLKSQLPDSYLTEHSDYSITNNGSLEDLELEARNIAEMIIKKGDM